MEALVAHGEVVLKVAVAPDERPGAGAIPGRVQDALGPHGFLLASVTDDAGPADLTPAAALASGRAVRVVGAP